MVNAPFRRVDDVSRDATMGFLEHLEELRTRLIRCCVAVAAGTLAAFAFVTRLVDALLDSIQRALPPGTSLVFIKPAEGRRRNNRSVPLALAISRAPSRRSHSEIA